MNTLKITSILDDFNTIGLYPSSLATESKSFKLSIGFWKTGIARKAVNVPEYTTVKKQTFAIKYFLKSY